MHQDFNETFVSPNTDLPARIFLCKLMRKMYGMRIDPRKHTYAELRELQRRRILSKKLMRECQVYLDWRNTTAEQMEKVHKERWVD